MTTEAHEIVRALTNVAPMEWFWELMPAGFNPRYRGGHGALDTRLVLTGDARTPLALRSGGWRIVNLTDNGFAMRDRQRVVMVSAHIFPEVFHINGDDHATVRRWVHVSMSRKDRCPTWEELVALRDFLFTPDKQCVQVLPPRSNHVSIHPNCLHLFHSPDGDGLPDFTMGTGEI